MKKLLTILLTILAINTFGQLTTGVAVGDIAGSDTTILYDASATRYNNALGVTFEVENVTGTGGTLELLYGSTDSTLFVLDTCSYTVNTDTMFIYTNEITPVERYGFKFTKGSVTAGDITMYFSRKIRK